MHAGDFGIEFSRRAMADARHRTRRQSGALSNTWGDLLRRRPPGKIKLSDQKIKLSDTCLLVLVKPNISDVEGREKKGFKGTVEIAGRKKQIGVSIRCSRRPRKDFTSYVTGARSPISFLAAHDVPKAWLTEVGCEA